MILVPRNINKTVSFPKILNMKLHITLFIALAIALNFSCESNQKNNTNETIGKENYVGSISTNDTLDSSTAKDKKTSAFVYGIDISKYQGEEVDFLDKQKDSLSFIICKATEGITYTDPEFKNNWATIPQKGFIRGAYHFYRSNDNPESQVDNFFKVVGTFKKTDLPPIVDFEEGGIDKSQSIELIQSNLLIFLNELEKKSNRKPIIYTDLSSGNKYLSDSKFSEYPLWIANYNGKASPNLPATWKKTKWLFWQKNSSYKIGSIQNDFDVFNGDSSELLEFIKTH